MVSRSIVSWSSVLALVKVVKSACRTFTDTVLKEKPFFCNDLCTSPAILSSAPYSNAVSPVSTSKVCSLLTDLVTPRSSTSLSSTPCASKYIPAPHLPNTSINLFRSNRASCPIVLIPSPCNISSFLRPIPCSLRTSSGSRNLATLSGSTTVRPSGLSRSEAILAADLVGAMPIEHVSPSCALICALISCAIFTAFSQSLTFSLISR